MSQRKQFTSCDACRKSRIGCDATSRGGKCTNCVRRGKTCSFDWIEQSTGGRHRRPWPRGNARDTALPGGKAGTVSSTARPVTANRTDVYPEYVLSRREQALTLHNVLWDIFTTLFEPQLGLWIGNDCNPFKRLDTAPKALVSRLMVTLDNLPSTPPDRASTERLGFPDVQLDAELQSEQDGLINQALISAVHAFSARWLPIGHFRKDKETNLQESMAMKEYFVHSIWVRALKDVTSVLSRPSYRSILALYLFGTTPTSLKNKERRMSDHCLQTSFQHYVQLRAKACIAARHPSNGHAQNLVNMNEGSAMTKAREEYDHLADTAYWFGIVIDGSRSLIRCQPSVLLPGLSGESQVWDPIRKQSERFAMTYRSIQSSKALLTDSTVMTMIQYGSSCKTLFWKAVSRVQDYFFYQTIDRPLEELVVHVEQEMNRFEEVFGPCLDQCGRDYILLSEKSRISYLILSFHFHLGVLILVDTLEGQREMMHLTPRFDVVSWRLSSTRAIVNLINLILLQVEPYTGDEPSSIILKDPYPEHTRNGLTRAAYSVLKLLGTMSLPMQLAEIMATSLFAGLEILSQISYTAAECLEKLQKVYSEANVSVKRRQTVPSEYLSAAASTLSSSITPEIFEEETIQQLGLAGEDPSLVDKTIERYEPDELPREFAWYDLTEIDFTTFTQDWAFEDCFSSG